METTFSTLDPRPAGAIDYETALADRCPGLPKPSETEFARFKAAQRAQIAAAGPICSESVSPLELAEAEIQRLRARVSELEHELTQARAESAKSTPHLRNRETRTR